MPDNSNTLDKAEATQVEHPAKETAKEKQVDIRKQPDMKELERLVAEEERIEVPEEKADTDKGQAEGKKELPERYKGKTPGEMAELLEEKEVIGDFFSNTLNSEGVSVTIGSEHTLQKLHTLSFVTTIYTYGNVNGVVGILGPTRMRYPWLISLINYAGQITSEILSQR